jgi:hypothetical protein
MVFWHFAEATQARKESGWNIPSRITIYFPVTGAEFSEASSTRQMLSTGAKAVHGIKWKLVVPK